MSTTAAESKVSELSQQQMDHLKNLGWTTEKITPLIAQGWNFEAISGMQVWDRRYRLEGKIWGDEPSVTAKLVDRKVEKHSRVLEIGFGYGRDVNFLLQKGYVVHGLDESSEGLTMAMRDIRQYADNGTGVLSVGNFLNSSGIRPNFFDAAFSHRVLHLINPTDIPDFVRRVAGTLREGGQTLISARNPCDFKPNQMAWVDGQEGLTAKYKDPKREGQTLNFWDKERFESAFGNYFNIHACPKATEPEATTNPVNTNITIMWATRKSQAEIDAYEQNQLGLS